MLVASAALRTAGSPPRPQTEATPLAEREHRAATDDTPDELWLVEHPPVFTLGLAGKAEHLLTDVGIPANLGWGFCRSDRRLSSFLCNYRAIK